MWAVANQRVHGTTHEPVMARWDADQFALQPVDLRPPYPYADGELRRVARDAYVAWQGSRYSVPWGYAGKEVWVRDQGLDVEVRYGAERIAVHGRAVVRHQVITCEEHHAGIPLNATGRIFGDPIIATAILDGLLHHSTTINIRGESYRLKDRRRAGLLARPETQAAVAATLAAVPGAERPGKGRKRVFRGMGKSIDPMARQNRGPHWLPTPAIVSMSLRPVIPWRVALQQCPPPFRRLLSMLRQVVVGVNHHLTRGGEFSTGEMGNFQPALTREDLPR